MSTGGEVSVKFTTREEAQAVAAIVKVMAAGRKLGEEVGGAAPKIDRADQALKRYAENVKRINATPVERLNAELAKLTTARDKGFLDPAEFERAAAALRKASADQAMAPNKDAAAAIAEQQRTAERLLKERRAAAEEAMKPNKDALRAIQEWEAAQKKAHDAAQREAEQTASKMADVGEVTQRSAEKGEAGLGRMATALKTGVAAAATVAIGAIAELSNAAEEAARKVEQSAQAVGQLGQLGSLSANRKEAEAFLAAGGAENLGQAASIVGAGKSAGLTKEDMGIVLQLQQARLVEDIGQTIKGTVAIQNAMGRQEAGSFAQLLAKGVAAQNAEGVTANMEQLIQASAGAGVFGQQQGLRDEEVLAAVTRVSQVTRTADTAGERVSAFLRATSTKDELRGKSLQDTLGAIRGMNLAPADLQKYLGSSEAMQAFGILSSDPGKLSAITTSIDKANTQASEIIGRQVADNLADPTLSADLARRTAVGSQEVASQQSGRDRMAVDSILKLTEAQLLSGEKAGPAQAVFGRGGTAGRVDALIPRLVGGQLDTPVGSVGIRDIPGVDWAIRKAGQNSNNAATRAVAGSASGESPEAAGARDAALLRQQMDAAREQRDAARQLIEAARELGRSKPSYDWSGAARRAQAVPAE